MKQCHDLFRRGLTCLLFAGLTVLIAGMVHGQDAAAKTAVVVGNGYSELKDAVGKTPIFGFYGSGETGPKDNDSAPCGVGYHIVICAILNP